MSPDTEQTPSASAQASGPQLDTKQPPSADTSATKGSKILGVIFSQKTLIRVVLAILLASAGAGANEAVKSAWPTILAKVHPSKYAYLEGHYQGKWYWTDPITHAATNTVDTVFFDSTTGGKLIGSGDDRNLGTYKFTGNLYGNTVEAAYLSDVGSKEPAQSGGFILKSTQLSPVILEGTWTGFMNNQEIQGTAKLSKQDDSQ